MSALPRDDRTAPDATKETPKMSKRLATLAVSIGALLLIVLPAASASAAEPWWQIVDGSKPSHLWEPKDASMGQEVKTELFFGLVFAAEVEVGGDVVGCLGAGSLAPFGGPPADEICEGATGFPASESAAEFETMLEGPYGAGEVEVTGGPVGALPFEVKSSWGPPVKLTVIEYDFFGEVFTLGVASSKILSEGSGRLSLILTNLGNAPLDATSTPLTITDELPEGVAAYDVEAVAGFFGLADPDCSVQSSSLISCTFEDELPSYEAIEVEVSVALEGSPPAAGAPGKVTVSGANAATKTAVQTIKVSEEPVPFGFERFDMRAEEEGGATTTQAGAHPFQVVNTTQLNSGRMIGDRDASDGSPIVEQPAIPRNIRITFPAGLVGTATPTPRCEMAAFLAIAEDINECPKESAVGVASVTFIERVAFPFVRVAVPIFNLAPQHGEPARLGFVVAGNPAVISASADPDDNYRITGEVRNITQLVQILSSTIALWGTPGDPRHDSSRGWECVFPSLGTECTPPVNRDETPFLRMPTECKSPLDYDAEIEPWNVPLGSTIDRASFAGDPLLGCNKVPFDPSVSITPTSKLAENPTGLDFELRLPGSGFANPAPGAVSEAQPKRIEVTLPEGITLNPSQAEGLAVCTPERYASERFNSKPGDGCPEASKIGSIEAGSPLIEETINGSLYVAAPYDNPSGSLIALYIVARSPERGILIKQPLEVRLDESTGRIVAIADKAPPAPYDYFKLHFREGARSPLVTPPACGSFETQARFTPYSAQDPDNPTPGEIVTRTASFTVQRGVDGGACPPGGVPPFDPGFEAGSINNNAGSHTDFNMRLIREDGEQNMTRFSAVLPPGVLGKLSGIDKCSDSAIAKAKSRTGPQGGREEIADPSCPANSEIGHSLVGAGVGSVLTRVPGKVYLGGSFNGAPLSVIAVTPVVAGPFDVGTVVVQEALTLNPKTAEVEVDGSASDPIPHILKGIPAKLRDLRVYVDRPDFIINPTSCDESSVKSTLFGSYLDVFSPADDKPVDLATRFQAANCLNLGFKPKLNLNLKGGTKRGGHPGLKALYRPRKGDANVKGLVVRLPRSAFLDQAHIRTICTRVQFAADNCPKAAQYGYIRAWTPLLDEPLQGPVWLRSSNHKLPDLVFDLHGLVDVEVATRIDSARGGIRATVENAPDAPLSKVELRMQGGKKGLIINSRNLCGSKSRANVEFSGHNGKEAKANPVMRADGCKKGKRKARHSRVR
jgi:hypothetical protein